MVEKCSEIVLTFRKKMVLNFTLSCWDPCFVLCVLWHKSAEIFKSPSSCPIWVGRILERAGTCWTYLWTAPNRS